MAGQVSSIGIELCMLALGFLSSKSFCFGIDAERVVEVAMLSVVLLSVVGIDVVSVIQQQRAQICLL